MKHAHNAAVAGSAVLGTFDFFRLPWGNECVFAPAVDVVASAAIGSGTALLRRPMHRNVHDQSPVFRQFVSAACTIRC